MSHTMMSRSLAPPSLALAGATVAFGTLHGKEEAFAPAFARWLGAEVRPSTALDTDALGTFTGDIPRRFTPEDAALTKARGAARELGTAAGLATEASYAPALGGFGPMLHEELAVFVDVDHGIHVSHRLRRHTHVTPRRVVRNESEARRYLSRAGFPHQGVVVRTGEELVKGVQDAAVILDRVRRGPVELEPDLRAHMNPERRRALRRLSWMLAARLRERCPGCGCAGFGPLGVVRGLPCAACGAATSQVRKEVDGCPACPEQRERLRPERAADPACCDACNP
ncbi:MULTISPECIES: DUF6671 family protein [Microbacterium]|uniref:DUF6671 family protein n=1 Tax=Microbacterium TaxID=33882 RepID=UPI002786F565|nr:MULTISPECIES: DUF6671 family protein [Microbacterium]MDQ1082461.1 hypothetical protein [Microbacterium sp. SORGH_AS_0344]MDQ1168767.1 hypothetical protein [Microbacterium proteolyticum]